MSQPSDQQHEPDEFGAYHGGVSSLRSRFEQMSQSEHAKPAASSAGAHLAKTLPTSAKHAGTTGLSSEPSPDMSHKGLTSATRPANGESGHASSSSSVASTSNNNETCRPAHIKKATSNKLHATPTAFGAPAPSLIASRHVTSQSWGGSEQYASVIAKVPPPRPPKPSAMPHKIIDDADLEELRHMSHSKVSSLAGRFSQSIHQGAERFNDAVNHGAASPHHRRETSRGHEPVPEHSQESETAKGTRPSVPPKPMRADDSQESLRSLPGTLAALHLEASQGSTLPVQVEAPSIPPPPPLPSRNPESTSAALNKVRRAQMLMLSKSTGSLPTLDHLGSGDDASAPPLPARNQSSYSGSSTPLPPQLRTANSAAAPVPRSVSHGQSKPIPTPSLPFRRPAHARSMSPVDSNNVIQSPPPPPTRSLAASATKGRSFFGSSAPTSFHEHSDNSSDEDFSEYGASLSPHSSMRGPLSAGRPSGFSALSPPSELPDTSRANRRAPTFKPDRMTSAKQMFQCSAVCGHTVATGSGDKVKVYRVGELATGMGEKLCTVGDHGSSKELKLTALEFRAPNHGIPPVPSLGVRSHGETADDGRYLWCGTKDGHIWELDVAEAQVVYSRTNVHTAPIQLIRRVGTKMISMDESGKISIWLPSADPDPAIAGLRLSNQPQTQRIALEKGSQAMVLGQQLWVASGPVVQKGAKEPAEKSPKIRIYNPFADDKPFNAFSKAVGMSAEMAIGVGAVTDGTIIPIKPDVVYLGHDTGHVSIWSRQTYECLTVQKLGPHGVTAVAGVVKYLWAANRTGNIAVYDTSAVPWRALKIWPAHKESITSIRVDEHGIQKAGRLQVASAGLDASVHLWDGTLSFDWLQLEQSKREAEFCNYRNIKMLNVTFNMDAASPISLESTAENMEVFQNMLRNACHIGGDPKTGGVPAERAPDVIVFGFQELIDLESKKLTAKSLLLGGKKKANDLGDKISHQYRAWYDKLIQIVRLAMPPNCGYLLIQSESLVGLFTCIFVKQSEFRNVRETAISTVKTGMGGRYGNKGAVIARMVIDNTSICFANCHLAAGQKQVKQRNADIADILESPTVFEDHHADPTAYVGGGNGSMVLDHELCFFSGDLNYRIDLKRETVISAVLSNRLAPLVDADQLRRELKNNPTFRLKVFCEAPLTFPPTYKYDRGTHDWDTSEKNRVPAWCDRILWRSHNLDRIRCLEYRRWEATISDHRPVTAIFEVKVKAIDPSRCSKVVEELQNKWKVLEQGILDTATAFYNSPQ